MEYINLQNVPTQTAAVSLFNNITIIAITAALIIDLPCAHARVVVGAIHKIRFN